MPLCMFNKDAPVLVPGPCADCRLVSQPRGCSCSSRWARGSGFNSPLHTSTFFLLLHLSLSFSCCEVLSCVGGSDALTLAEEDFLKAAGASSTHMIAVALVITQRLFGTKTMCLALTKVSFTCFGVQSATSSKKTLLPSVNTGDLSWAGLSWK